MPEIENIEVTVPTKTKKLFPQANIKNIRLFYWLTAFTNAWFISGNWIFYWTRFMTFGQLGIMDATCFAFGLVMEVPSGAISDLIGKKKTVIAAMLLSAIGVLGMAATINMQMLWVAFLIAQLGWALYSGAAEALAYDTLVEHHQEENYDQVISSSGTVSNITSITAILSGGVLYAIHYRLSHLAWGLFYLFGFFVSLALTEPRVDTEKFSFSNWVRQLVNGTKQLLKPAIRPFLIVILALLGIDYLYNWGLVKPAIATSFDFFAKEQAIIFGFFGILSAVTVRLIPTFRKYISDKKGLYLLTLVMGIGFLLAYFPLGYWGLIPMLLIALSGSLAYPWISVVVNKEIPSKYRATTLSTVALITKLPYVALAVVAGRMVEEGKLNVFNLATGMFVIASILLSGLFVYFKKGGLSLNNDQN